MTYLNGGSTIGHPACPLLAGAHRVLVAGYRGAVQLNPAQSARLAGSAAGLVRSVQLHCDSRNLPVDQPAGAELPGRMEHAAARCRLARERLEDLALPGRPAVAHPLLTAVADAGYDLDLAWALTQDVGGYQHLRQVWEVSGQLTAILRALAEIAEATSSAAGGAWVEVTKLLRLSFHAVHAVGQHVAVSGAAVGSTGYAADAAGPGRCRGRG